MEPRILKKHTPYILVSAAVPGEVDGLRSRMEASSQGSAGFAGQLLSGRIRETEVMLLVTGPGLVNTACALAAAIESRRPGLIIQTGCAGAFKASGLRIGDIGVATQEIDVQLGLESGTGDHFSMIRDLPFPVLKIDNAEYFNRYPVDAQWTDVAYHHLGRVFAATDIRVQKGPFVTVSTITATNHRAEHLYGAYGAIMEQMEGSAAAHVAAGYGISFVEIRCAANHVGYRDRKNWDLPLAFKNSSMAVYEFIQTIKL
ncbi:MAG: futalosine hydrolase [Desulfobacteraceae bacterium]|nr:MAG: futalosine hydrolase [Desulfobacteraceae bacterium]